MYRVPPHAHNVSKSVDIDERRQDTTAAWCGAVEVTCDQCLHDTAQAGKHPLRAAAHRKAALRYVLQLLLGQAHVRHAAKHRDGRRNGSACIHSCHS